jgi:hypothetical protein
LTVDRSVGLTLRSSGTTLSASAGVSSLCNQWHNKLRPKRMLFGPLKLTASVSDPGSDAGVRNIAAALKPL